MEIERSNFTYRSRSATAPEPEKIQFDFAQYCVRARHFTPFIAQNKNAVDGDCAEVFDDCQGHPGQRGVYHYHSKPSCVSGILLNFI